MPQVRCQTKATGVLYGILPMTYYDHSEQVYRFTG